jgi:hypothetical protein
MIRFTPGIRTAFLIGVALLALTAPTVYGQGRSMRMRPMPMRPVPSLRQFSSNRTTVSPTPFSPR